MAGDLNFLDVLGIMVSLGLAVILLAVGAVLLLSGIGIPAGVLIAAVGAWCGWRGIQIMRCRA